MDENIKIKIGKNSENYIELLIEVNDEITKNIQKNIRCPQNKLIDILPHTHLG